jgi:thiol-disulfide isomerase/thioredoxin
MGTSYAALNSRQYPVRVSVQVILAHPTLNQLGFMKRIAGLLLLGALQLLLACGNADSTAASQPVQKPAVAPQEVAAAPAPLSYPRASELTKDYRTWYNYTYHNILLAQDFIGLTADSVAVPKATFLRLLATGKFIPLKIRSQHSVPTYKLWRLTSHQDNISQTIQQLAAIEQDNYSREGKTLPAYHFTDLTGKTYDPASTKGKIVVLKCWFIACVPCVKEFPELNQLVDEYKDRKDILFVSLATDSRAELEEFISVKHFSYAVVPEQTDYMREKLSISGYPTHILIDKKGKVLKVSSSISDLKPFLAQQAAIAAR